MYKISLGQLWEIIDALREEDDTKREEKAKFLIEEYDLYE